MARSNAWLQATEDSRAHFFSAGVYWEDIEEVIGWMGGLEAKAQETGWTPREDGQ